MGLKYLAFCGIGSPENFFTLLKKNKIKVNKKLVFPDHYKYQKKDINKIKEIAFTNKLEIITTEKDYTKIKNFKKFKTNVARIDLRIEKPVLFKNFLLKNL